MEQLRKRMHQHRDPIEIEIPCKSRIKKLAYDNAYTLFAMAFFFIVFNTFLLIRLSW